MSAKKKQGFAEAYEELENITQWFSTEEASDLDEGLKKFERGLKLASQLKSQLDEVENKLTTIKETYTEE